MSVTSRTERALRRRIHDALVESRLLLRDYPELGAPTAEGVAEAQNSFQLLAQCLAEAASANSALRHLDELSAEGLRTVGAIDVALLVLGSVLATLAAELDFARSVA